MTDTASSPPNATPTIPARIDRDLYCVRCEYNLRTLPPDALCPECGHPVAETLRDEADPLRIKRLRSYMGFFLFACWVRLVHAITLDVRCIFFEFVYPNDMYWTVQRASEILNWPMTLVAGYAVFQLTRRRMLPRNGSDYPLVRWTLRIGVVFTFFKDALDTGLVPPFIALHTGRLLYTGLTFLIGATLFILILWYLSKLLAPCPIAMVRYLRLWVALAIVQSLFFCIRAVAVFTDVASAFPLLFDLNHFALHALDMATTLAALGTLTLIRSHLQHELQSRHNTEVNHEHLANRTA
jgi:hypothetical protein